MPAVNWDAFLALPGSAEANFERVCRALVRWHYGQFGDFGARAMQPGVEFHLRLQSACSLGATGRWFGWQCRWYDLPAGRALSTRRRRKIEEALRTTERELPDLTDWVLWTRRPLTRRDQKWFRGLATPMRLHLWTADDVESHLSGPGTLLRGTYFGELVLTPEALEEIRERSVAPIRRRWVPEVHQRTKAERAIARALGRGVEWGIANAWVVRMERESRALVRNAAGLPDDLLNSVRSLARHAGDLELRLREMVAGVTDGDVERTRAELQSLPPRLETALASLPRRLRALRHPSALDATNLVDSVVRRRCYFYEARRALNTRLLVVVAGAGYGKTQLAAQLTAPHDSVPAGVLLHGRDLHAGGTLDVLAHTVVIQGSPVASMEALVAAVDSAGQRARRRLPIFIDGLNEAEDPRDWYAALASMAVLMQRYANTIVVCTIRPAFVGEAVPPDIPRLSLRGFSGSTMDAIGAYFSHYRINPADAELPVGMLHHPLTLRLFCEVTNPERERVVGVESMPGSLTSLFDRYLEQAAARVAQLAPRSHRYLVLDVRQALDVIGTTLWQSNGRSVELAALRSLLGDSARPWSGSLVRALEEEGVLIRVRGQGDEPNHVAVVYDLLAGHVIADARIGHLGRDRARTWLSDPATLHRLAGDADVRHPLGEDVFAAVAGLLPRRMPGEQLWPLVAPPLRMRALRAAAKLEGRYLDTRTVDELGEMIRADGDFARTIFGRLCQTRGSVDHPLNSDFLDTALRSMSVADRDLIWTEWLRVKADEILKDMVVLGDTWRERKTRNEADMLRAQWTMWILTTTVRELRDQATRALYWFGRGDPSRLFGLALAGLGANDPYVGERVVAAAYGTAMAHQVYDGALNEPLEIFLRALTDRLTGDAATDPTNHWLIREYVRGLFQFAGRFYPSAVPDAGFPDHSTFAAAPVPSGPPDDAARTEVSETLHMDFHNYTLGGLVEGRANYDSKHEGHRSVVRHVEDTVWDLGWRCSRFAEVDGRIVDRWPGRERRKIERYGKKYSWVGFFTCAGLLAREGRLPERGHRMSDVDLDPSFPDPPQLSPLTPSQWPETDDRSERDWITAGAPDLPRNFVRVECIEGVDGPWVAVCGQLEAHDYRRQVWGHFIALLVADGEESELARQFLSGGHWHGWAGSDVPQDYYTFAGEIPWHPEFAQCPEERNSREQYQGELDFERERRVSTECVAHRYAWESYHSPLNNAGGALVPSRPFSEMFDLRGVPQAFHQTLPDGTPAALSLRAPTGFEGELLYVREELLERYAEGRSVLWLIWGERLLTNYSRDYPDWLIEVHQARHNEWRMVWRHTDLAATKAFGDAVTREDGGLAVKGRRRARPGRRSRK